MILVDSSVLIDILADRDTPEVRRFEELIMAQQQIAVGDLMLVEVLQGIREDWKYEAALTRLSAFTAIRVADHQIAEVAARHYRSLRERGVTIRKTIDTLIATRCIVDDIPLLYADRDFRPFTEHFGLRSALFNTE